MKITDLIVASASDNVILSSTADYLESLNEKAVSMVDDISYISAYHDAADYVRPTMDYSIAFDYDGVAIDVDTDQFVSALETDAETITDAATGVVIKVDDLVDQISSSINNNRIICTAIKTMSVAALESASIVASTFYAKLSLSVGNLTETGANLASNLLELITQKSKSVGDRVRDVLAYIGVYNVSESPLEDIGFPECRLKEVTGSSCWSAWFASMPKRLSEFVPWIKDFVSNLLNMLKSVVAVVVGSSTYRALQKFFLTMTKTSDSFSYLNGESDDNSISNMGFSWKHMPVTTPQIVPGVTAEQSNTIDGALDVLYAICNLQNLYGLPAVGTTMMDKCQQIFDWLFAIVRIRQVPLLNAYQEAIRAANPIAIPENFPVLDSGALPNTTLDFARAFLCTAFGRLNGSLPSNVEELGINDCLQYVVGSWMDFNHINDEAGMTNHMNTNSYVQCDLPGSTLYFWLVGSQVICTRRVVPLTQFMDMPSGEITHYFNRMFKNNGIVLGNLTVHGQVRDSFGDFLVSARANNMGSPSTDSQMMKAVYAANLADAMFLQVLDAAKYNDIDLSSDLPNDFVIPIRPEYWDAGYLGRFVFTHVLTGRSIWQLRDLVHLDDGAITNLTLAQALGADLGYVDIDTSTISDSSFNLAYKNLMAPFVLLTQEFDKESSFIPYVHSAAIQTGQYGVMLDSELANVTSLLLKVIAVVAATIYVARKIKALKKKSLAMSTRADAVAWSMIENNTYTQQAINQQYKLLRRAELCDKLSSALFGSVSKLLSASAKAISSSVSAMTSKVKNLLSGGDGSTSTINDSIANTDRKFGDLDQSIGAIRNLISG